MSRPAPSGRLQRRVGLLVQPGGELQRPAADVDHQQPAAGPAEPAAGRQEGQPRLVLAARAPAGRRPARSRTRPSTSSPLGASRIALVAKASRSSTPWSSATVQALLGELHRARRRHSGRSGRRRSTCSDSRSSILCDDAGSGWRADVRVDHEQVHGVGSDVDDPESHGSNVATDQFLPGRRAVQICPTVPATDPGGGNRCSA